MKTWRLFALNLALVAALAGCALYASSQPDVPPAPGLPAIDPNVGQQAALTPAAAMPVEATVVSDEAVVPAEPLDTCPVTRRPDTPFIAPAPNEPSAPWPGYFWYGTNSLWTALRDDGTWAELPQDSHGYGQKQMWWREGYVWTEEPEPDLTVTGRRLDGDAPPIEALDATNAYAEDIQSAMLTGVNVPTLGCWEITGHYGGADLTFVVRVAP
jgi:hypothetical protein